jgi:voltage-gated potassium channel
LGLISHRFSGSSFAVFSKLYYTIFSLLFIILFGTIGYMTIEGYRLLDAFYMTVITISTVGFSEFRPLSDAGRLFTTVLIMSSFGTFAYTVSAITTYVADGEFNRYFKDLRVQKQINNLKDHVIICGHGRNGNRAAIELQAHKKAFVVIENAPDITDKLRAQQGILFVDGDAKEDEVLRKAGIDRAQALITTMPDDSDNLYVVVTARGLNKKLFIVSRAASDSADSKLRMAGANNVIMPDKIGGAHMASLVIKPDVVEFLDSIITQNADASNIEELDCKTLPGWNSASTVGQLNAQLTKGALIIGFKKPNGGYIINPAAEVVLEMGSKLFVLGTQKQLEELG